MITIQLKDKNFNISLSELELVTVDEWYLSLQIKYTDLNEDNPIIEIDEEYQIFKDIIDSFKFRTLIITDIKMINYYEELGKKWLFPEWLLELITEKKIEADSFQALKKMTLDYQKCINCGVFFKVDENHKDACHFHPDKLYLGSFTCCGYEPSKFNYENKTCRKGYHGVDQNFYATMFERNRDIIDKFQDKYKS